MAIGKTNSYILTWIEQLQSKGKIAFSYDEVITDFPEKSENAIIQSLSRLSQRGRVVPVYKGFYLIVPAEYAAMEILPPILFIDYLMEYIGKPYYIGLLSAAALYGAAHQQASGILYPYYNKTTCHTEERDKNQLYHQKEDSVTVPGKPKD